MVVSLELGANDLHIVQLMDATATPSSLASTKSRMVYPSGTSLPRLSWKKAVKRLCVCACVHACVRETQKLSLKNGLMVELSPINDF